MWITRRRRRRTRYSLHCTVIKCIGAILLVFVFAPKLCFFIVVFTSVFSFILETRSDEEARAGMQYKPCGMDVNNNKRADCGLLLPFCAHILRYWALPLSLHYRIFFPKPSGLLSPVFLYPNVMPTTSYKKLPPLSTDWNRPTKQPEGTFLVRIPHQTRPDLMLNASLFLPIRPAVPLGRVFWVYSVFRG